MSNIISATLIRMASGMYDALAPGQVVDGPAVIESATTTVLLGPSDRSMTTSFGWLDVKVGTG